MIWNLARIMIIAIRKKTQEISFALIRIAGYIRRQELATRIESQSYALIEDIYSSHLQNALSRLEILKGFIALGSNLGEVTPNNSQIVLSEMNKLETSIRSSLASENQDTSELNLKSLFTSALPEPSRQSPKIAESQNTAPEREEAIIRHLQQAPEGKLQLKDLMGFFPGISERTLRYDLERLCGAGKVRREGSGGPSNYYILTESTII